MSTVMDAPGTSPPVPAAQPVVALKRRTIDTVLIALGVVAAVVFALAGALLTWGSNFADDYVHDELSSQNIFFPDADALTEEGRDDLLDHAGKQVMSGDDAEAYASYIGHHLDGIADGATYADLGGPERAAKADVAAAVENGASEAEVAELQATADGISNQRNTLFKGETLRGLLLTTFAWSTMGRIAGIAAMVAFAAAAVTVVLVAAGFWHHRKTAKA